MLVYLSSARCTCLLQGCLHELAFRSSFRKGLIEGFGLVTRAMREDRPLFRDVMPPPSYFSSCAEQQPKMTGPALRQVQSITTGTAHVRLCPSLNSRRALTCPAQTHTFNPNSSSTTHPPNNAPHPSPPPFPYSSSPPSPSSPAQSYKPPPSPPLQ